VTVGIWLRRRAVYSRIVGPCHRHEGTRETRSGTFASDPEGPRGGLLDRPKNSRRTLPRGGERRMIKTKASETPSIIPIRDYRGTSALRVSRSSSTFQLGASRRNKRATSSFKYGFARKLCTPLVSTTVLHSPRVRNTLSFLPTSSKFHVERKRLVGREGNGGSRSNRQGSREGGEGGDGRGCGATTRRGGKYATS